MMKKFWSGFFLRGLIAAAGGPVIMAIVYGILGATGTVDSISVTEMSKQILTVTLLALIVGGMNSIYQVEQLPLMVAILIHGCVLYVSYLATYLVNGWLEWGITPILVFSAIFIVGFLSIGAVIYSIIRRNTNKLNQILKEKQQNSHDQCSCCS